MTGTRTARSGPPLGRHVAAAGVTVGFVALFFWIGSPDLPLTHAVLADASFALLCVILMLGAGSRLVPRLRPFRPWGRELGIAMFVTAALHVVLLIDLDFSEIIPSGHESTPTMWRAAWWIGLLAFAYALVLFATSNDSSQRLLGRGWKFVQRQAYTLFVLTWMHMAAYVLFHAGHGKAIPTWLFWSFTIATVVLQFAGFVRTVRTRRGPFVHRVTPKHGRESGMVSTAAARWIGVVGVWGAVVTGSWMLSNVPSTVDRQVAVLCERYAELRESPMEEIREQLVALAPDEVGPGAPLNEWLELCEGG